MRVIPVTKELVLMDRAALAQWTRRSVHTIRAKCPVHSHGEGGRAMYDANACAKQLDGIVASGRHAA